MIRELSLIISLKRRALTPFAWLRAYARGAVAPSGPLRSPAKLASRVRARDASARRLRDKKWLAERAGVRSGH